jgi:hypothetical protein
MWSERVSRNPIFFRDMDQYYPCIYERFMSRSSSTPARWRGSLPCYALLSSHVLVYLETDRPQERSTTAYDYDHDIDPEVNKKERIFFLHHRQSSMLVPNIQH